MPPPGESESTMGRSTLRTAATASSSSREYVAVGPSSYMQSHLIKSTPQSAYSCTSES
jgi:hypothetical protein